MCTSLQQTNMSDAEVQASAAKTLAEVLGVTEGAAAKLSAACWARAETIATGVGKTRSAAIATDAARSDLVRAVYAQACRAAVANLSDDVAISNGNSALRTMIAQGRVDIGAVPFMTPDELAPGGKRAGPRRCRASPESVASDAFECPICAARKCVHYELQTRSADEATTIFVTCIQCGHRWTE